MNDEMNVGVLLADQLAHLLEKSVSREMLVATENGELPQALWKQLDELDLGLALVPEECGGAGLNWTDLSDLFRTLGRYVAPVPLGETMVGAWTLGLAGVSKIPRGVLSLVTSVVAMDEAGLLTGTDSLVPWASMSDQCVLVATREGKQYLCLVKTSDATIAPLETIGRIPSDELKLDKVHPLQAIEITTLGELGLLPHVACLRALQMGGALDRMLALCVEYGNTRTQFGRTIGKFQAIQHMIAELASQTAAAQAAGIYACRRIDAGDAAQGAAIAKTQVGRAAGLAAAIAHQVFGAIGVTDEHELHYYTRRLWQWRAEAGSEHWWSERLGRQVLARGGAALWPSITG